MAQDIQLSQYYHTAQYMNPAFVGTSYALRLVSDTRLQWPALGANYLTSYLSADYNLYKYRSGIGGYLLIDYQGDNTIRTIETAIQYAAWVNITDKYSLRAGLQVAYNNRDIDYSRLTFPSQYNATNYDYNNGAYPSSLQGYTSSNYFDAGAGLLLYSNKFWIGYSLYHLNPIRQNFINSDEEYILPRRHDIMAGFKFKYNIGTKENIHASNVHIMPTLLFKKQAKSDQLDLGLYTKLYSILVGAWYRGIPIKNYNKDIKNINNESVIFLAGIKLESFSVGYSYDLVISKLFSSHGAHEISITYTHPPQKRFKPKKHKFKSLPCPKTSKFP